MAKSALACCIDKCTNLRQQFCLSDHSHKPIAGSLHFWAEIQSQRSAKEFLVKVRTNKSASQRSQPPGRSPVTHLGSHG